MLLYRTLVRRSPFTSARNPENLDDRGFALVAVVIASALVAILALTLMNYSRVISISSQFLVADVETQSWAEAGLNRILLAYSRPDDLLRKQLQADGRPVLWEFHGRTLALRVLSESSKLDLNAADRTHISNLLGRLIDSQALRSGVLERIDAARYQGVKLRSVAEILPAFERMTSLRDDLELYFTVYTNQIGIDAATASQLTIETMPGMPTQLASEILKAREVGDHISLANLPSDIARRFVQQKPIYTFRVETRSGFNRAGAMRAVVLYGEHNKSMILSWDGVGIRDVKAEPSGLSAPF